jgi:hypothetical protein
MLKKSCCVKMGLRKLDASRKKRDALFKEEKENSRSCLLKMKGFWEWREENPSVR